MKFRSLSGPVMIFFALVITYLLLKFVVYYLMPLPETFDEWAIRDLVMDVPRLVVGLAALIYGKKKFGNHELGLYSSDVRKPIFILFALLATLAIDGLGKESEKLSIGGYAIVFVSSFVVGLFEEVLFRGLGLAALKKWRGPVTAVVGSSLAFTAIHSWSQPIASWASIFLIGVLFSIMRLGGVSIYSIIFIHGLYDALWFLLDGRGDSNLFLMISMNGSLCAIAYYLFISKYRAS